jgi:hypothetical protein
VSRAHGGEATPHIRVPVGDSLAELRIRLIDGYRAGALPPRAAGTRPMTTQKRPPAPRTPSAVRCRSQLVRLPAKRPPSGKPSDRPVP